MRGKGQPDGRPALQIIETPFLYFSPLLDQSTRAIVSTPQNVYTELPVPSCTKGSEVIKRSFFAFKQPPNFFHSKNVTYNKTINKTTSHLLQP